MRRSRPLILGVWLILLGGATVLTSRTHYSADLTAFLPRSPSVLQRLLVQQLRSGPSSRLILIGIQGADSGARAHASIAMASALREDPAFTLIANGAAAGTEAEQSLAFAHRYQLSAVVTPERFSVSGLHSAIADSIDLLASPGGLLAQGLFASDPTGETLQVLDQLQSGPQPRLEHGVWSSHDGQRALLIAQTRAEGADTDAQAHAVALIRNAFERTRGLSPSQLSLLLSGPGVLSVQARDGIKHEAVRLSLLSTLLILALLLAAYRSIIAVLIGMIPVLSGALVGIATVALGFGVVYGVTLGFGVTLIGESVDYPIYYLVQSHAAGASALSSGTSSEAPLLRAKQNTLLWSTIALGALTSIFGFASLLSSEFSGLAQLGLYSVSGLIVAAAVTRFVVPALMPARLAIADLCALGAALQRTLSRARLPLGVALALALLFAAVLVAHRGQLWNRELAALSPVPITAQRLDGSMRADLGAPDVSNLVIVHAATQEAALEGAENVGARLDPLLEQRVIGGYDSPARVLPSQTTQQVRIRALPESGELRERLAAAVQGLPVKATTFEPFVQQLAAARTAPPLTRVALGEGALGLAVDSLLWHEPDGWTALLPLHAPRSDDSEFPLAAVRSALSDLMPHGVLVYNLKQETDRLYDQYLSAAIRQSLLGCAAIVVLLAFALRRAVRVARVLAPLLLAVLTVSATLTLAGVTLTIMHLIGMLLIIAIGSNYALFFDRAANSAHPADLPRTLASLLIANAGTVIAFSVLASSQLPVLNALGRTVAPGTLLVLVYAALLAPRTLFDGGNGPRQRSADNST
jgi:predicted exporter